MNQRVTKWVAGVATAAVMTSTFSTFTTTFAAVRNPSVTINETGSSLLYPLFNGEWIPAYKAVNSSVAITASSTGSGAGISQAMSGTAQIGASDAYMADAQMAQNPSMVNIPVAISAQQVMYNLPGISTSKHVNLSGDVLAKIYEGKITKWNDPAITKLNKGLSLPDKTIVTVHRSDSSGDTFLFTTYLTDTNTEWKNTLGFNTSVSWPAVAGTVGAKGNDGIVTVLAQTPYSISYVGISYLDQAVKQGIGYAALQNKSGKFTLPETKNIQAAVKSFAGKTPRDERMSLIYAPGNDSYPIINYEYAIVNTKQSEKTAGAVKSFLTWAISPNGGNNEKYLSPVHFLPLPSNILALSKAQIRKIGH